MSTPCVCAIAPVRGLFFPTLLRQGLSYASSKLSGEDLKFLHSASFTSVQHCGRGRNVPRVAPHRGPGESHSSHRALCAKQVYPLSLFINCKIKCALPALMRGRNLVLHRPAVLGFVQLVGGVLHSEWSWRMSGWGEGEDGSQREGNSWRGRRGN